MQTGETPQLQKLIPVPPLASPNDLHQTDSARSSQNAPPTSPVTLANALLTSRASQTEPSSLVQLQPQMIEPMQPLTGSQANRDAHSTRTASTKAHEANSVASDPPLVTGPTNSASDVSQLGILNGPAERSKPAVERETPAALAADSHGPADAQSLPDAKSNGLMNAQKTTNNAVARPALNIPLTAPFASGAPGPSHAPAIAGGLQFRSLDETPSVSSPTTVSDPELRNSDAQPPAPLPAQFHTVRMIQTATQSEMRMEMRTHAFGDVEIHATVSGKEVQMSLGADHGDLRNSFALELPALQNALQQHGLRLEHVRTLASGSEADLSSGSSKQEQKFQRPGPRSSETHNTAHSGDDPILEERCTRLSVRA
jgi:hypothetical protein